MTVLEAASPPLLHKNVPVAGIKVLDEEQGIVEAFVAGIGNKDSTGDIIQPGAFDDSLKVRTPKGVWSHDWSRWVSKTLEIYQVLPGDPRLPMKMASRGVGGLYVKTQFNLKTRDGQDAFENVKFFGDEAEWSIGYMEVETEYSKDLQANLLMKIDLYEYSPVLFGANSLTSTVSVKVDHVEDQYRIQVTGLGNKDLEAQVSKAVADTLAGKTETQTAVYNSREIFTEVKVVPGSLEARYGALCEALMADCSDGYAWPIATFADSIVYEVMSFSGNPDDSGTFQRSYSIDEAGAITFGDPKAVSVVEVVIEKMGGPEALEAKGGSLEALTAAVDESRKALFEEFQEKAGRVLSTKNRDRLAQAKNLIDEVINSAEKAAEEGEPEAEAEEKEIPVEMASNDPLEVVISGEKSDEEGLVNKGAIASHSTKTDDGSWDGPANKKNVTSPNEEGKAYFGKIFAWVDPEGDATVKASYKFIHHEVSSDGTPGAANLTACSTGIGVLNGGRSGTTIPDADVKGVYNHLAKHLRDAGKEPPELKIADPGDLEMKAAAAEDNDDPDEDVRSVAEALDAAIDAISEAVDDGNLDQIDALVTAAETVSDQLLELVGGTDADDEKSAEETDTKDADPDDMGTHHTFVKGDTGYCSMCGQPEDDPVHMMSMDPDDQGAGKAEEVDLDVQDLIASLDAELALAETFLASE